MMAPKVPGRHRNGRVGALNKVFSLPRRHVARYCKADPRNIAKQKSFAGSRESPTKVGMALASPNILVVEDDRETRTLIAKYLRTNACHVTTPHPRREIAPR